MYVICSMFFPLIKKKNKKKLHAFILNIAGSLPVRYSMTETRFFISNICFIGIFLFKCVMSGTSKIRVFSEH